MPVPRSFRARRADSKAVESAIRRALCIQLDSSRRGAGEPLGRDREPRGRLSAECRAEAPPKRSVIEYWAHTLYLLPAEDWPLLAYVRDRVREQDPWHGDVKAPYPGLVERVLGEIRERGALGSRDFGGKRDPSRTGGDGVEPEAGEAMLDALFAAGEVVIAGRDSRLRRSSGRRRRRRARPPAARRGCLPLAVQHPALETRFWRREGSLVVKALQLEADESIAAPKRRGSLTQKAFLPANRPVSGIHKGGHDGCSWTPAARANRRRSG